MAMAEKKSLFVHGENGGQVVTTGNPITDLERARTWRGAIAASLLISPTSSCT